MFYQSQECQQSKCWAVSGDQPWQKRTRGQEKRASSRLHTPNGICWRDPTFNANGTSRSLDGFNSRCHETGSELCCFSCHLNTKETESKNQNPRIGIHFHFIQVFIVFHIIFSLFTFTHGLVNRIGRFYSHGQRAY